MYPVYLSRPLNLPHLRGRLEAPGLQVQEDRFKDRMRKCAVRVYRSHYPYAIIWDHSGLGLWFTIRVYQDRAAAEKMMADRNAYMRDCFPPILSPRMPGGWQRETMNASWLYQPKDENNS